MATNPMQRKSRGSFILGMVVMLLIALVVVGLLFMRMQNIQKKLDQYQANEITQTVYVLNQDVKAGQVLEPKMFKSQQIATVMIPSNATTNIVSTLDSYKLRDTEGNRIYSGVDDSKKSYYFIKVNGTDCTIYKTTDNGEEEVATNLTVEDTAYYYEGNNKNNNSRKTITIASNAVVAKVDLTANTVITSSLVVRSDEAQSNDVRQQEYNMLVLPTDLVTEDYVDVRIMLPNGQDFIIVSKKQVTIPEIEGEPMSDTVIMNLTEDEILSMSSAIVEAYRIDGSKLYVTKYTEPGIQTAATPTYPVNADVYNEIRTNPNIVNTAKEALNARYNTSMRNDYINSQLQQHGNDDNVKTKMDESIQTTQENRKEYLESLAVPATTTTTTTTNTTGTTNTTK